MEESIRQLANSREAGKPLTIVVTGCTRYDNYVFDDEDVGWTHSIDFFFHFLSLATNKSHLSLFIFAKVVSV